MVSVKSSIQISEWCQKNDDLTSPTMVWCWCRVNWASLIIINVQSIKLWQIFALSRDGGVPYSKTLRKVNRRSQVPVNGVWCASVCAIILGMPILWLNVVFTAITSICTIGWVGSYAVPIFARLVIKDENFTPGPFRLGRSSRGVCLVAFLWICYTCVIFLLPTTYPITLETLNYAPVAIGTLLIVVMGWWAFDARHWFKGPVREISK